MIDEGVSGDWPKEVRKALAGLELGDLIERPRLVFPRDPAYPLWLPEDEPPAEATLVEIPEAERPPFGIITTQTCDLDEEREYPLQPWYQASPVYPLEGAAAEKAADRKYLYRLNGLELPEGQWFADLRIEAPFEKSTLVKQKPIKGFATANDAIRFAEVLGRRRDRAALATTLVRVLDGPLRTKINNNKSAARRHYENVHGVYVEISEGTRNDPGVVGLHVITRSGEISDEARDWFDKWYEKAAEAGEKADHPLNVQPIIYHDGRNMDLEIYDPLIAIERRPSATA